MLLEVEHRGHRVEQADAHRTASRQGSRNAAKTAQHFFAPLQDLMLKNLKKRKAQLTSQGEHTEANAYNFFPLSFEMSKVKSVFAWRSLNLLSPIHKLNMNRE